MLYTLEKVLLFTGVIIDSTQKTKRNTKLISNTLNLKNNKWYNQNGTYENLKHFQYTQQNQSNYLLHKEIQNEQYDFENNKNKLIIKHFVAGVSIKLKCFFAKEHDTKIEWRKDNRSIHHYTNKRMKVDRRSKSLLLVNSIVSDSGNYACYVKKRNTADDMFERQNPITIYDVVIEGKCLCFVPF